MRPVTLTHQAARVLGQVAVLVLSFGCTAWTPSKAPPPTQTDLQKTAITHWHPAFRRGALTKIADLDALVHVACEAPEGTNLEALQKLKDRDAIPHIARVAVCAKSRSVQKIALDAIQDPVILEHLLTQLQEMDTRVSITTRLTNRQALLRIAMRDEQGPVREAALASLSDQDALMKIAAESQYPDTRCAAINRISDPTLLSLIARTDPDEEVRAAAVRQISDDAILLGIVRDDPELGVRLTALMRVTDQAELSTIATDESYGASLREVATRNLRSHDLLARIATGDKSRRVRDAASGRLHVVLSELSDDELERLACEPVNRGSDNEKVVWLLACMATAHIRSEDAVARIAVSSPNFSGSLAAICRTKHVQALESIIDSSGDLSQMYINARRESHARRVLAQFQLALLDERLPEARTSVRVRPITVHYEITSSGGRTDSYNGESIELEVQAAGHLRSKLAISSYFPEIFTEGQYAPKSNPIGNHWIDVGVNSSKPLSATELVWSLLKHWKFAEPALVDLARTGTAPLALACLKGIREDSHLEQIALAAAEPLVRVAAIGVIDNQRLLEELALNDSEQEVRLAAVARVSDRMTLHRIRNNTTDAAVRDAASARSEK